MKANMSKFLVFWILVIMAIGFTKYNYGQVERKLDTKNFLTFPNDMLVDNWDANGKVLRYYVDPSGSDANDGQSWANAKSTLQGALDDFQTDLGGYDMYVFVLPGTYNENVSVTKTNGKVKYYWYGTPLNDDETNFETWARNGEAVTTSYNPITIQGGTGKALSKGYSAFAEFRSINDGNGNVFAERWVFTTTTGSHCVTADGGLLYLLAPKIDMDGATNFGIEIGGNVSAEIYSPAFYGGSGAASTNAGKWKGCVLFGVNEGSVTMGTTGAGFTFDGSYPAKADDGCYFEDVKSAYSMPFGDNGGVNVNPVVMDFFDNGSGYTSATIYIENTIGNATITTNSLEFVLTDNAPSTHTVIDLNGPVTTVYLTPNITEMGSNVIMGGLPTSDPGISGALWNNLGILNVSP